VAELGDTQDPAELVPGKPGAIEENARVLQARADRAGWAAEGLQAIDTGSWQGPAALVFHDKFSYEPAKWYAASDALESAADALNGYASTLRWAQAQAIEAIAAWNQAQAATQQAHAAHDQATAQAAANNQPAPGFTDPGEAERQAARDILTRARTQRDQIGNIMAAALRHATEGAPQGSSWLDDLGNFVADAGAHLVNGVASFGNAMINHPMDVLTAAAGAGLTVISSAGEGLGVMLDATGIGAAAGVPLNVISAAGIATGATMTAGAVADMAVHAAGDNHVEPATTSGDTAPATEPASPQPGLSDMFPDGVPPKASDLDLYAHEQGWTKVETPEGPPTYYDSNGIKRMVLKQGSGRTPGSEDPHIEIRNDQGQRIDPHGNPVTKKSDGNHTPIEWDW
jgi:hypothetical protein